MPNDLLATARHLHSLASQLADALNARPSDPFGPLRAEAAWRRFRQAVIAAGSSLPAHPRPLADWIRELGRAAMQFDRLVAGKGMNAIVSRYDIILFDNLIAEGQQLLRTHAPKSADPWMFTDPPPTATADPGPTPTPATTPSTPAPTATADPGPAPPTPSTPPPAPAKILVRWRDIVEVLPLRETMPRSAYEERRRRLAYLNQRYSGPIQTGGKGGQPRVDLAELLDWWNALTSQVQHAIDRERDTAATLLDQHNYGRTGRVAPGIVGSIKARRQREGR